MAGVFPRHGLPGSDRDQKMLPVRPTMPKIQRAKKSNGRPMKGRPITAEEFDRMLGAVSVEVGDEAAA